MKVKLLVEYGGHGKDTIVDVPEATGRNLVNNGMADIVRAKKRYVKKGDK